MALTTLRGMVPELITQAHGVLALPVHDFPMTLVDVEPEILLALEKFFRSLTKLWECMAFPHVGKTPLGRAIAMAMSRC